MKFFGKIHGHWYLGVPTMSSVRTGMMTTLTRVKQHLKYSNLEHHEEVGYFFFFFWCSLSERGQFHFVAFMHLLT